MAEDKTRPISPRSDEALAYYAEITPVGFLHADGRMVMRTVNTIDDYIERDKAERKREQKRVASRRCAEKGRKKS